MAILLGETGVVIFLRIQSLCIVFSLLLRLRRGAVLAKLCYNPLHLVSRV